MARRWEMGGGENLSHVLNEGERSVGEEAPKAIREPLPARWESDGSSGRTGRPQSSVVPSSEGGWRRSLAAAIRNPDELLDRLGLSEGLRRGARAAAGLFPVLVPESYLARMRPGDPRDPLLLQVLPLASELESPQSFTTDAVGDMVARRAPGLLHKYPGRVLLMAARACAVHCRYCFRRHYPYESEPAGLSDWVPALETLAADPTVREVILSGGDPLILTDRRLGELIGALEAIAHLRRLRIHSRLPIVLPDRIDDGLLALLRGTALTTVLVVHANHPAEIVGDCAAALRRLVTAGLPTLNQSVLLRGVNDDVETLAELSERLIDLGVIPYYLHQLDRVTGTAHFEVGDEEAMRLVEGLRTRLPGYAVPRLVREVPGAASKLPVGL